MNISQLDQVSYPVITAIAGAYMSGSSFLMPVSHMLAAPVVAYAIGAELAPIALGAYAIAHGVKYAYEVFSESESSSGVALAKATVGGLLAAGTSAAIGVVAYSVAASKLAEDVGELISYGYGMVMGENYLNSCQSLKKGINNTIIDDVAGPISAFLQDTISYNAGSELGAWASDIVYNINNLIGACGE